MAALSLLEGCKGIFEKSHEIWKSYFSRWETLAELEEDLPEKTFISEKIASKKKQKDKAVLLKSKRKLKERIVRKKKVAKKNKNKTVGEVIEQSKSSGNENVPEETDNKQLEIHLRTIFMDILKANENKWEVFAVLSQTFSHGDVTVKGPHSLHPDHRLALPSNDIKKSEGHLLFKNVQVFCPKTSNISTVVRSDGMEFFFGSSFSAATTGKKTTNYTAPQFHSNTFSNFRIRMNNFLQLPNSRQQCTKATCTPFNSRNTWSFKSCPTAFPNNCGKIKLKSRALDFRDENTPKSWRKTKNEYFCERKMPEMNTSREEKRSGSLCLHKTTNDLNMENSNFVTPERNPSKRKCFSENISQRKRRRPTKLFFDFWEDSDSENDEQIKSSTPQIGWQSKSRKIGVTPEVVIVESDSDESDSIL